MKFIKENPALAAGIGLPIILIIFFYIATAIPRWTVAPPKYNLVFSVQEYSGCRKEPEVNFKTVNGKIAAEYKYNKNNVCNNKKLYIFDAKTLVSREINFNMPPEDGEVGIWKKFDIPELESIKLDNSPVSPDGYQFADNYRYNYRSGFFPFGGYYGGRNGLAINKDGRVFRIYPNNGKNYSYSINNTYLLGWIIADGE
ncbi:MAG: hypothetical protein R3D71_05100 [Rickettsiales bacterium]